MPGERDLHTLLAGLAPEVRPGAYVVVSVPPDVTLRSLASVHEAEGVTHVVLQEDADARGLAYDFVAAWITLRVHSALDAVGVTAAVSGALAEAGISCNVLAGYFHDHLLVPHARAAEAVTLLRDLDASSTPGDARARGGAACGRAHRRSR